MFTCCRIQAHFMTSLIDGTHFMMSPLVLTKFVYERLVSFNDLYIVYIRTYIHQIGFHEGCEVHNKYMYCIYYTYIPYINESSNYTTLTPTTIHIIKYIHIYLLSIGMRLLTSLTFSRFTCTISRPKALTRHK